MEKKEKQAVWLYPRTKELIIKHMDEANARSQSEFIENAIKFYSGYLDCNSGTATEYLAHVLTSIIDGIVKGSEYRINRGLFKLAVESAMQSHIIAAVNDVDDETIDDLRGMCVDARDNNGPAEAVQNGADYRGTTARYEVGGERQTVHEVERRAYESADAVRVAERLLQARRRDVQKHPFTPTSPCELTHLRGSGRGCGLG